MPTLRIRGKRWWLAALATALVAGLATSFLKPMLEQSVRARIESAAVRHGMVASIGLVRVGVWPLLRLERVDLHVEPGVELHVDTIEATWPGRLRLGVHGATIAGPAAISVTSPATVWDVDGIRSEETLLTLVKPQTGLSIRSSANPAGSAWHVQAHELDVAGLFDVRRNARPLFDGAVANGRVDVQDGTTSLRVSVDLSARGARLAALADSATDAPQLGDSTDVTLRFNGAWERVEGSIEIPDLQATFAGAALSGSLALRDLETDPAIELALGARRVDFAQLLGASGLEMPLSLELSRGGAHDLGSATIDVAVRGRLADPASLSVTQKIAFSPPLQVPPAIERLRGDFVFRTEHGSAPRRTDVSPASPDYIALHDVPPLFLRTLLVAEDAGFYGHRGIDLRELPPALLTNWSRGGAARGASTITQQLAKNLFLSPDKQLGRKLQELAITFLLESELGKERILEIYLNIIEWGPGLRGLRPAAHYYFNRDPQALKPAEMAFLVAIIPGPMKYQNSFARGSPGPGLRALIDNLLAKLRSVDAIGEAEYQRALQEPILVTGSRTQR